MATVCGAVPKYPLQAAKQESVLMRLHFVTDNAGAISGTPVADDPGISVTKSGTGAYAVVFPKCPSQAVCYVQPHFTSTFPTAGQFVRVSAKDLTAGTLTITTSTTYGGAAADLNQAVEFDVMVVAANGRY